MSVRAVVKEIKSTKIPSDTFVADKDYEEISLDQLMQMSGR
jgi:hypothetical protein